MGLRVHGAHDAELAGSSDVVLAGDCDSAVKLIPLFREPHASIASARQLLLTFAKEAAALESFNFSA